MPISEIIYEVSETAKREGAEATVSKLEVFLENLWGLCQMQVNPSDVVEAVQHIPEVEETKQTTSSRTEPRVRGPVD